MAFHISLSPNEHGFHLILACGLQLLLTLASRTLKNGTKDDIGLPSKARAQ
jgi:hypothetical protein